MFRGTARITVALVAALAFPSTAVTEDQDARPESPAAFSVVTDGFGVQDDAGVLRAGGPRYKARFGADAFVFTPALPSAARNHSLSFRLGSISRGDVPAVLPDGPCVGPTRDGDAVVYARGPSIEERYEVRRDGVRLSYVFRRRPSGVGDLVVRMRLETELPLVSQSARDGLEFELAGVGGLTVGAVTGIDARGRRVDGEIRLDGAQLELRLPGEFVQAAAYPMVLDPLVGGVFSVASAWDESDPDIAYDHANGVYLVTWERSFSAADTDIRAQLLNAGGAAVGGLIFIRTDTATSSFNPTVANLNSVDFFVVAYEESGDIFARAVKASNGVIYPTVTVASGTDQQITPDAGGDSATTDSDALVVWWNATSANIEANQVQVFADGSTSVVGGLKVFSTTYDDQYPTISKSGGPAARYLITWRRTYPFTSAQIRGMVVDKDLNVLDSSVFVTSGSEWKAFPDNDGDGTEFLVAYQTEVALSSLDNDIACRTVSFDPATNEASVGPEMFVEAAASDDEIRPAVSYLGSTYLVGYADWVIGDEYDAYVKSIDPFHAFPCEGEFSLDLGGGDADFVAIASQWSGESATATEQALIVWEDRETIFSIGDINGLSFLAADGLTADLGGGCGEGGTAQATCARVGNVNFRFRVRGARPASTAYLILGAERLNWTCGPCTLVPDPFTGFVFSAGVTDTYGHAEVAAPIPNEPALIGLTFFEQWFIQSPTPACAALGGDLSNALAVEIE